MGVAGSGKSTIGHGLSERTGWPFYDADAFHPPENIKKMRQGIPLTDADRQPWLLAVRNLIDEIIGNRSHGIIACSALKNDYRNYLQGERQDIYWVYLKGDYSQILERLHQRQEHFMKSQMLPSQWEILEEPENALTVSISNAPETILDTVLKYLNREIS